MFKRPAGRRLGHFVLYTCEHMYFVGVICRRSRNKNMSQVCIAGLDFQAGVSGRRSRNKNMNSKSSSGNNIGSDGGSGSGRFLFQN